MKRTFVLLVVILGFISLASAQQSKIRLSLVNFSISSGEIQKNLENSCPEVVLTLDQTKADYLLEAQDIQAEHVRKNYSLTLFDKDGDAVFHTATLNVGNAVKDVCKFIRKNRK